MQNRFLVTTCTEELWITTMICIMLEVKNRRLYWIVYGSPTGGKSKSWYFYSMYRGQFIMCLEYFLNEYEEFRGFRLILSYIIIHNNILGNRSDIYNLGVLRKKKKLHHLETAPDHAKKCRGSNWYCSEKYKYQKYI